VGWRPVDPAGPALEERQVAFDILLREGDPIHNHIERIFSEQTGKGCLVAVHIPHQQVRSFRHRV